MKLDLGTLLARPWAKRAAYGLFGGLAFLGSLYLTFPAEAVGQRLSHELNRASGGEYSVSFGDVSLYRLTGVAAEDVQLKKNRPGQEPFALPVDGVRLRLALLPLLWLTLEVDGVVELGEGELDFAVARVDGGFRAALDAEALSFAAPPILPKLAGLPIAGRVAGKTEATWIAAETQKSQGKSSLTIRDAGVGPGEIAGFKVPQMSLGQIDLAFDLQNGRLRIAAFQQRDAADGKKPDLELKNLSGSLTLRGGFAGAAYDLCIEARPSPALLAKDATLKAAAQLAEVQFKKDAQGFLHLPVKGNLGSQPRPGRNLCRQAGGTLAP